MPVIAFEYQRGGDGRIFYRHHPIKGADPDTFEVLNATWARDRNNVYTHGSRLTKADPASFVVLNHLYAKDHAFVYSWPGAVKEADPVSFRVLDDGFWRYAVRTADSSAKFVHESYEGYAADSSHVFHYLATVGKPGVVRGADVETFRPIGNGYAKDSKSVYYHVWRIAGADPTSFEVIGLAWGRDRSVVAYGYKLIPGANPATFEVVDESQLLARDGRQTYCRAEVVRAE